MIGRARELHPVAWWLWAIGLAAYASQTTNPLLSLLAIAAAFVVVSARRSEQPWAGAFRLYVQAGLIIVIVRVLFHVIFGGGAGATVWLHLPRIPLPGWVLGITLLGPVTREAVLAGVYDGLRLAAILVAVGAANALANPKRMLRSLPSALYEVGTALVVAVTVLPQLAESLQRVRRAQSLRAGHGGRFGRLRRIVVPVLEDALERSLALAAGMDTRGYGRTGDATKAERRVTGALMLVGVGGICIGAYAVLDPTFLQPSLAAIVLIASVGVSLAGFLISGRRVARTAYRPDPWQLPELLVVASGVVAAGCGWWVGHRQPIVAHPDLLGSPTITLTALIGVLVALTPAIVAPLPRRSHAEAVAA